MVRRDIKFARSLSIATKLKFPFPHMVAVVVRERTGGGLQLLTQGTADIILDSCIEFWDGHDLCPLSASDRYTVILITPKIYMCPCILFLFLPGIFQEKGAGFLSENKPNIVLHRVCI